MTRRFLVGLVAVVLVLTGCTATVSSTRPIEPIASGESHPPVTLNMWSFHGGPEAKAVRRVLDRLHEEHPWLTVNLVEAKDDFSVLQGIYSGRPPDIAVISGPANVAKFCATGAMPDLNPVAKRDGVDLAEVIPPQVLKTATYQGKTCVLPWLTDSYGLFYNKEIFAKAGIERPPRTLDELEQTAKKLTTYNQDGSIKTAGFVPLSSFYHSNHMDQGPTFGADWYRNGRSALATDPRWAQGLRWQKKFIDSIGYRKLQQFAAKIGADSEYTPNHALATGKVAMVMDGEWRAMYLKEDAKVDWGTAPFPVLDERIYGSGQIGGTMISLPATAKDPAASWLAVKYLALDTGAMNMIADGLHNVPTTYESLETSAYSREPVNAPFVSILKNPHSQYKELTPAGQVDIDLLAAFVQRYEAGRVPDLERGLRQVAKDIDAQVAVR